MRSYEGISKYQDTYQNKCLVVSDHFTSMYALNSCLDWPSLGTENIANWYHYSYLGILEHPLTMLPNPLIRLQCGVNSYDWGKIGSDSAAAKFAAATPSDTFSIQSDKPYAEVSISFHLDRLPCLVSRNLAWIYMEVGQMDRRTDEAITCNSPF